MPCRAATSIASYSLRARPGAPVAVPLSWDELDGIESSAALDIDSLPARLSKLRSDPWERIDTVVQDLDAVSEVPGIQG